ncbi:hypothetical protein FRC08_010853 [Ceratobasidium sp. 394]|nr:hypothetical protein FRC08_010853 [Ceratobasidium sp. 394]
MLVGPEHARRTHLPLKKTEVHSELVVSSVSAGWRSLVLATPGFWSSICFHENGRENQLSKLSLVRAGSASLDVQVVFPKALTAYDWLPSLRTRFNQIRTLDLVLPDINLLHNILAIWPHGSLASSLTRLSIKVMDAIYKINVPPPKVLPTEAHEQMLGCVTSLSLYGGYFDWDSAAFDGLEHLQLAGLVTRASPTLSQILRMLRASPRLRTLSLCEMEFSQEEYIDYQPIHLEHLQKLSFISLVVQELIGLVPLLVPGTQPLTIHILRVPLSGPLTNVLVSFLRRSNVQYIYFHDQLGRKAMSRVLSVIPRVLFLYFLGKKAKIRLACPSTHELGRTSSLTPPIRRTAHFS